MDTDKIAECIFLADGLLIALVFLFVRLDWRR